MWRVWFSLLPIVLMSSGAVIAEEKHLLVGAGALNVLDDRSHDAVSFGIEGSQMSKYWSLQPVGVLVHEIDGSTYAGVGLLKNMYINNDWFWGLSLSVGVFHKCAGSIDLGSDLEFLSTVNLNYRLSRRSHVRFQLGHLSNSGVGDINPGTELLSVNLIFPTP